MDDKILDSLARLFKLLSDANRLRILFAIGKEKKSVSEIVSETSLSQTLVSFHLRPLRESGMLTTARQGPFVYYSLAEPAIIDLLLSLAGFSPEGEIRDNNKFMLLPMRILERWLK
ncbi:MAG: ArsR/SmtB family transcription factor [Desulfobacca sp.]|uniref:ArsR/SmtB family transcription factor n=1 Tax=Desulfobacca sp. TaxID=2067990 RepID=UPI0040493A96